MLQRMTQLSRQLLIATPVVSFEKSIPLISKAITIQSRTMSEIKQISTPKAAQREFPNGEFAPRRLILIIEFSCRTLRELPSLLFNQIAIGLLLPYPTCRSARIRGQSMNLNGADLSRRLTKVFTSQSQAVRAAGLIFVSGQIPAKPDGSLVEGSITDKTIACCEGMKNILEAAGSSLARITKVRTHVFPSSQVFPRMPRGVSESEVRSHASHAGACLIDIQCWKDRHRLGGFTTKPYSMI